MLIKHTGRTVHYEDDGFKINSFTEQSRPHINQMTELKIQDMDTGVALWGC